MFFTPNPPMSFEDGQPLQEGSSTNYAASGGVASFQDNILFGSFSIQFNRLKRNASKLRKVHISPRKGINGTAEKLLSARRSLQSIRWLTWKDNSKWLILMLLHSALASLLALLMDYGIELIEKLHDYITEEGSTYFIRYFNYLWFRVLLVALAVLMTQNFAPIAAGSGIPEMKAALAGFELEHLLTTKTLIVKSLGVTLAIGSGLPVGKEGPFVHTASAIAEQLMNLPWFAKIRTCPELRQQILSTACAVGVSAAFGAPIGGVLFSVEATSHYFISAHYSSAFFCAVFGAFVVHVVSYDQLSYFTPSFGVLPWKRWELPLFLIMALALGVVGGWFTRFFVWIVSIRRKQEAAFFHSCLVQGTKCRRRMMGLKVDSESHSNRSGCSSGSSSGSGSGSGSRGRQCSAILLNSSLLFSMVVAASLGAVEFPCGSYMRLPMRAAVDDLFQPGSLRENSTHTHLATASWSTPNVEFNLLVFTLYTFATAAICITLPVSNGLVTPVFAIGAAMGRLAGEILHYLPGLSSIEPGGYAVVGAAAFSAAVTGKISIAVVVFELTGQLSFAIPVLLSVVVAHTVGIYVGDGSIYDRIATNKKLPHWPSVHRTESYFLTAADVMVEVSSARDALATRTGLDAMRSVLSQELEQSAPTPTTAANELNSLPGGRRSGAGAGASASACAGVAQPLPSIYPVVSTHQNMFFVGAVYSAQMLELLNQEERRNMVVTKGTSLVRTAALHKADEYEKDDDEENSDSSCLRSSSASTGGLTIDIDADDFGRGHRTSLSEVWVESQIDLIQLGLVDFAAPTITTDTPLAQVSLLFAVHKYPRLFVIDSTAGTLAGYVDVETFNAAQN